MSKYTKSFAENLRYLMGDMSISEFAKKVGIPQPTISRYLNCQREVTLDNIAKIADFFNESVDFLIGRERL
ncbi:MAG: helix-turn-helix transcriptional regulator [Clostridiales bacterium]|nr:helix-turn-helix transcriptional regulator [Clostridiales bacterium]